MAKKINLEEILAKLSSDEARTTAICRLIGKVDLSSQQIEKTVEVYDPKADTWSKQVDMPTGRSHFGATVFKGEILGEKKKYLGVVTKQFVSPCDGILENID